MEKECCEMCAINSRRIDDMQEELNKLKSVISSKNVTLPVTKLYSSNSQSNAAEPDTKSYKHPDLSFINKELMISMFCEHKDKLPYKLFRYIYFAVESAANGTIKLPTKTSLSPRNLTVCDYGEWHKSPAADVLIDVNAIICGIINTYLTKGDFYDKMDLADKKLIGDMVCRRFDKKITAEFIKLYMSAVVS